MTIGRSWSSGFAAQLRASVSLHRRRRARRRDRQLARRSSACRKARAPSMPQDRIRIAYARGSTVLLDMQSSADGLGDIVARLRSLVALHDRRRCRGVVEHQAADRRCRSPHRQRSNGCVAGDRRRTSTRRGLVGVRPSRRHAARRWRALCRRNSETSSWSGFAGIGWRAWRGLELKAQLDAHSAVFDEADLDFLGDALVLTVGGDYRFASGWQLDIAVSEDIAVESASDVVFVFGLRRALEIAPVYLLCSSPCRRSAAVAAAARRRSRRSRTAPEFRRTAARPAHRTRGNADAAPWSCPSCRPRRSAGRA